MYMNSPVRRLRAKAVAVSSSNGIGPIMAEEHAALVDKEVLQLQDDIRRIGKKNDDDKYVVEFGTLFDDEKVEQFYEALVGTLKAAKKRGIIDFKGQMLLKGAHDGHAVCVAVV